MATTDMKVKIKYVIGGDTSERVEEVETVEDAMDRAEQLYPASSAGNQPTGWELKDGMYTKVVQAVYVEVL